MTDCVRVEVQGHTQIITINRPDARNAVNADVWTGVSHALTAADSDDDIRVVVLTGAGEKSFCAGADLKARSRGETIHGDDEVVRSHGFAGFCRHPISKPTIAAVNGFALGGGTELVLAADLCIAADTASFGLPEVTRGIIAGGGGALRLVDQIPQKHAMEMLLTGRPVSAREAKSLGLVNDVVPHAELMESSLALAHAVGSNAPLAVQATKRVARGIEEGRQAFEEERWRINDHERDQIKKSQDAVEGARAFAEKRSPKWLTR